MSRAKGPIREPTYSVLMSMLEGLLHGYAIIERTGELSGGRVRLSTWTLYIALDDLSAEGDVEPVRETIDGWGRRSYGLTPHRACELLAQANRMAAVVSLVTGRARQLTVDGGTWKVRCA